MRGCLNKYFFKGDTAILRMRRQLGFTIIEIIALMIIVSVLTALFVPRILVLHEAAERIALQVAREEYNTREHLAWAKYKIGSLPWSELQKQSTVTGEEMVSDNDEEARGEGDYTHIASVACIVRTNPTANEPGTWVLEEETR